MNDGSQTIGLPFKPLDILLVDDDNGDAKAVRRAFRHARIRNQIIRQVDGVEALNYLRSLNPGHERPLPLLLVDISMPRMTGHELVAELRRDPVLKQLIVFMLTTSRDARDVATAYGNSVAGYITKERAGEDFLGLVRTIDQLWHTIEAPKRGGGC